MIVMGCDWWEGEMRSGCLVRGALGYVGEGDR